MRTAAIPDGCRRDYSRGAIGKSSSKWNRVPLSDVSTASSAPSEATSFWQIANPPERLTDAYTKEPEVLPPEWNIDFVSALNRLLTATCIGLISESHPAEENGGAK